MYHIATQLTLTQLARGFRYDQSFFVHVKQYAYVCTIMGSCNLGGAAICSILINNLAEMRVVVN